jgi:hypothetical protein
MLHIGIVFGYATGEQVCRIDTFSVVASMANTMSLWNWPIEKLIAKAMG